MIDNTTALQTINKCQYRYFYELEITKAMCIYQPLNDSKIAQLIHHTHNGMISYLQQVGQDKPADTSINVMHT